ncbi:MAG: hypothetical protein ABI321_12855 [Polyangia bacterium]
MTTRNSLFAVLAASLLQSGCYEAIYKAVVDDPDHKAGGTLVTSLAGVTVGSTPALATANPMSIDGGNIVKFIINITAGDDVNGADAHTALAVAGATISLPIDQTSRSSIMLSYGGRRCRATAGVIDLSTDTALLISGSFDATGFMVDDNEPCQLNGTLTSVPQVR